MGADDFEPSGPPVDGDAIDHLWNAAHETLRAMRLLIDAADEFVESQRGARPASGSGRAREGRVRHIDIDLDSERDTRLGADTDIGFGSGAGAS